MAAWVAAFKVIPWVELIAAAPIVVRGAKKLWAEVRHGPEDAEEGADPEERLRVVEAKVADLRKDLTEATEVIRSLVEQHARLVESVGILRARVRALIVVVAVLAAAWIALVAWVWR
jgi:hypothetical protein